MFRDQVARVIIGTIFLFLGVAACGIAAMRRWRGGRVLVWLGIWSALYGARPLADALARVSILPHWLEVCVPYVDVVNVHVVPVVASLAWMELSLGRLRFLLKALAMALTVIALAGISLFALTGASTRPILYNQLLTTCLLFVLLTVVVVPSLSRRFLIIPNRGVLLAGTLLFAVQALFVNLARPLGYRSSIILDSLAFGALLFSFGYVAVRIISTNERRLQSIEDELAIAHEIQTSIIPSDSPRLRSTRIAAAYRPMRYVAGDFYDFIPVDESRAGFLVADVAGHGVPAALIAAMIKVAVRSIEARAHDPREVLRGLSHVLHAQLRNRFITASYLWIDMEKRKARYSAAGHPPLLRWQEGRLERIESNGLLFGVTPEPDYPVCELALRAGDRLLLYTDGLVEPESPRGEFFGDRRLEEVIRDNQSRSPSDLVDELLSEIRLWQPASSEQQDDITVIVIDVI